MTRLVLWLWLAGVALAIAFRVVLAMKIRRTLRQERLIGAEDHPIRGHRQ